MWYMIGSNDEQTTCDHCGRANLKLTVVLEDEDGNQVRYGTACAARAIGRKSTDIKNAVATATTRISQAVRWATETRAYYAATDTPVALYHANNQGHRGMSVADAERNYNRMAEEISAILDRHTTVGTRFETKI